MNIKELLEVRKGIKKKKPDFTRTDSHKKKRVGIKWRKPKGIQNKMRLGKRGYRRCVSMGYRSPVSVRGLSKEGLKPILVYSLNDLKKINKESEGIVLANSVGMRKKKMMVEQASKDGIKILNLKDPSAYLKKVDDILAKRKEAKLNKEKEKEEKKKVKKGKTEKKEEKKEITEEEKEKEEKKEKDKLLTKKV